MSRTDLRDKRPQIAMENLISGRLIFKQYLRNTKICLAFWWYFHLVENTLYSLYRWSILQLSVENNQLWREICSLGLGKLNGILRPLLWSRILIAGFHIKLMAIPSHGGWMVQREQARRRAMSDGRPARQLPRTQSVKWHQMAPSCEGDRHAKNGSMVFPYHILNYSISEKKVLGWYGVM